jgi:SH3-like domain-containing protein
MKKKDKNYYTFFVLFFLIILLIQKSYANESINYLSLKNNEVNVRVGPSKKYPVKFTYKKKNLPLEILDKSDTWRKIKDFEKNSGWIHISQLSKKKSAINVKNNSILYKKSTIYSEPIAKLEIGRLVLIKKCKDKWCKITSGDYSGWIFQSSLWGKLK